MASKENISAQKAKNSITLNKFDHTKRTIVILVSLVIIAIAIGVISSFEDGIFNWRGLAINLATEIIGAVIVYVVIELLIVKQQEELIRTEVEKRSFRNLQVNAIARLRLVDNAKDRQAIVDEMKALDLFKYADLSGIVLADTDLSDGNLQGVNFSNADLTNIKFTKGENVYGPNFKAANLREAKLDQLDLSRMNLSKVNLEYASLNKSNLEGSILTKSNLHGANLIEANLKQAKLDQANMQDALMTRACLENATLEYADLKRAKLIVANLNGANLSNADLQEAILGTWSDDYYGDSDYAEMNDETILPNGATSKYHSGGLKIFTDPKHPTFWRSDSSLSPAYYKRQQTFGNNNDQK